MSAPAVAAASAPPASAAGQTGATSNSAHAPAAAASSAAASSSHAAALAAASTVAAAASSSSSLQAAEFFFSPTTVPTIQHGSFHLTGQDCVALARTVDLLARCGFNPQVDARYASLLALWTFVHRYHFNVVRSKAHSAAHTRHLESQLQVKSGVFSRSQYMQMLLQMKCLSHLSADGLTITGHIPQPTLDIMKAFTKQTLVPNCPVEPHAQAEILKHRQIQINTQIVQSAGGGSQSASVSAATALAAGTSISSLVANDPAIAFFQNNSLQSLSFPPNNKQLELIPSLLGPRFAAMDPCTIITEVLVGSGIQPQQNIDILLLKRERDRMVKQQMKQRKAEIDVRLHEIRDSNAESHGAQHFQSNGWGQGGFGAGTSYHQAQQANKPPLWLEIDSLGLGLVDLQRKVRSRILRTLPVDTIVRDAYRSRRDVEAYQRVRDKAEKKTRLATERHLKKTRRNYLAAIANHCRDFQTHHRELHKKLSKAVCAGVIKYWEDREKRALDYEKNQEKARLALLKDNNEEAYVAMLKEAKNERLLSLLKQTDEYMAQLSKQITQEQDEHAAKIAIEGDDHSRFKPTADGHIPSARELMNGDVFSSSAGRIKTSTEKMDDEQDETPEQADRRRMMKREEEERIARQEKEGAAAAAADPSSSAAMTDVAPASSDAATASSDAGLSAASEHAARASSASVAASAAAAPAASSDPTASNFQSSRKQYYSLAHKTHELITEQPKMLKGGQLRAYQMEGLQWLVSLYNNRLNGILADEMGLGKTVQSLSLIAYLMEVKHNYGPFLIIVPMSTLHNNWEFECDRWLPGLSKVVYDGDKDRRKYLRENFIKPGHFNIIMTTFEFAMRDKNVLRKIPWKYIIIDEAHRLKNPSCKLAQELATYPKEARRVALTGTPLQNDLVELWSLLNFLHPHIFNSSDSFEKWFSTPFDRMPVGTQDKEREMSMNEEEKLLVINRLHSILRPFMLRREKKQVESDLADKIEKVLRCELTPMQKAMYEAVLEGKVTMHNKIMQLRKIANHPILFHPYLRAQARSEPYTPDESLIKMCGKFGLLDQILHKLKRTGHRVLIFNQMTKVMDILEDYCKLRSFTYLRLDGGTNADDRTQSLIKYNAKDSPYFLFMLSTRAGGLGLNLQSADTVILFDSDWNPQNDAQAMARSHRIGQKSQVIVLRFITTATVEEKVLTTATTKLSHEQMVIQAGMFHEKYSHNASRAIAAEAMAREQKMPEGDTGDDEADQWTDGEISRTLARSDAELALFLEMDAQSKRDEAALKVSRHLPEGRMPQWAFDWCVNGQHSTSAEQHLVPFNDKLLNSARAKVAKLTADPLNPTARISKAAIVEVNTSDSDDDVVAESSGVNDAALNDEEERPLNYDDSSEDEANTRPAPAYPASMATPAQAKKSHKKQPAGSAAPSSRKKTPGAPSAVKRKRDDEPHAATPMQSPYGAMLASPATAAVSGSSSGAAVPKKKARKESTPGEKKPAASRKKPAKSPAAAAPASASAASSLHAADHDDDGYTPLSYSSDDNDGDHHAMSSHAHPTITASSGGTKLKLVIRGAAAAASNPEQKKKVIKKKPAPVGAEAMSPAHGPVLIKKPAAAAGNTFSLSTAGMQRQ